MTTSDQPSLALHAWDRASPRERVALVAGAAVVIGALVFVFVWQPLTRDLAQLRDTSAAGAAALAQARTLADDIAALSRSAAPPRGDLRAAVDRALGERGLRPPAVTIEAQDNRLKLTLPAIPFATLVTMQDGLRKDAAAFVVEGTFTPRVEPGTVRAELVLAR